ncbi:hypothetical protein L227DRAFT_565190 [Lentinus tigrinus ALCF2SS1-6]|uniref:Eukaryotic translation initiation factor 4G1 eIF4E-binding domain-containing protein n=1 Tax=Lentinus tigrinus ALCF2SS1-6 TaxID=1328759 RepID=A0A5C2S2M0_9APHY|nr:hypothetical protein L227DRAFT_565190 [Lentinus tigrinus ALCF2SS1-6]
MATYADAARSQPVYVHNWRGRHSSLSGGVKLSMATEYRSPPPPFLGMLQRPQDTSENPVFPSPGAAMRSRAVQQTLIDPGPRPDERASTPPQLRSRAFHSLPPTPTSDMSVSSSQTLVRSATLPTCGRSPGHLNAKAHAFVPGRPVYPIPEVDLNEYIKQGASCRQCPPLQPSGAPLPVDNMDPSDEEDVAKQWREQMGVQAKANFTHLQQETPKSSSPIVQDVQGTQTRFGWALSRAKNIQDLSTVPYPEGIRRIHPRLNRGGATKGIFLYDRDFLLQFKDVCRERPDSLLHDYAASLKVLASPGEHPPLDGVTMPKSWRKQRESRAAHTTRLAFGSLKATRGSDDVRVAPSVLPLTEGQHLSSPHRTRSIASDRNPAPNSPRTVVGTMSESESIATRSSSDATRADAGIGDIERRKESDARFEELERRVASLTREVESLREEVRRLQALHSPW